MEQNTPRIVIAGTNSGCGKTTVTCAVLQALRDRGLMPGAFKCGPDYIDPMFHSRIIGARSGNLDLFLMEENTLRFLLAGNSAGCDVSIIEGVMGYYDGLGLTTSQASTYEVARATRSPAILVVNAKGLALSVLAVIEGFLSFCPDNQISGVILNQCTAMTYPALREAIEQHFKGRVRPLGYLPAMPQCALESRHLGLVTAQEVENLREKLQLLSRQAQKSLDLDGILSLAKAAPALSYEPISIAPHREKVRIGIARDRAFCFYYEDSLQVLRDMGAELVSFSPMEDGFLPADIQGLYLGGGYPELYAEKLGNNVSMRQSIRRALDRGLPCIAECGGFMYLGTKIGEAPAVGFLPGASFDRGKLTRFGYVTLTARKDNLLCSAGDRIPAHEFHHWDSSCPGEDFEAEKLSGKTWPCCFASDRFYGGYPHFHFYGNLSFAENFYNACVKELHSHD